VQRGVDPLLRQPFGVRGQFDDQHRARGWRVGQADDAEIGDLQQAGEFRWCGGDAVRDDHPIIGDQGEAQAQQAQCDV